MQKEIVNIGYEEGFGFVGDSGEKVTGVVASGERRAEVASGEWRVASGEEKKLGVRT